MVLGEPIGYWLGQIALGIVTVVGLSVAVGASAPRWPADWLRRDRGPLRLWPGDDLPRYERLGALPLKRLLPEAGSMFGGQSKSTLPKLNDPDAIRRYVREARRGEWVHWLSCLAWLPLIPLLRPWLWVTFAAVTFLINGMAIVVLRYNRIRLYGVLDSQGATRADRPPDASGGQCST